QEQDQGEQDGDDEGGEKHGWAPVTARASWGSGPRGGVKGRGGVRERCPAGGRSRWVTAWVSPPGGAGRGARAARRAGRRTARVPGAGAAGPRPARCG